jgi:hypothetical protein
MLLVFCESVREVLVPDFEFAGPDASGSKQRKKRQIGDDSETAPEFVGCQRCFALELLILEQRNHA